MDEVELYDDNCPRCGNLMYRQDCPVVDCDDGWIDVYEHDPLWYDPDDYEICQDCEGRGHHIWCPNCGYNPYETDQ